MRGASMVWLGLVMLAFPQAGLAQMPANWTEPFEPVQIADNLFYVGSAGLSAFLLTSDDGHMLIDATLDENVPRVLDNIRSLGFEPRDIRVHLVTHAHFDHVAGAAQILRETGAELLVSELDATFLSAGRDFGFESDGYPPAQVTRTLAHLETVRLGDIAVTAHATPGHTPGCTSWSGTVTISGDPRRFVLVCSLSALSDYRLAGDDPTYSGQAADFCQSLGHLRSLESDIFLSNHGQFFGLEERAASRRAGDALAFVDSEAQGLFLDGAAVAIDRALTGQGLPTCSGS